MLVSRNVLRAIFIAVVGSLLVISEVCGEEDRQDSACGRQEAESSLVEKILGWWPSLTPPPSSRGARGLHDGSLYVVRKQDVENGKFLRMQISAGGYSFPVFGNHDKAIYALRGDELFQFEVSEKDLQGVANDEVRILIPRAVGLVKSAVSLLGFSERDSQELLLVRELGGRLTMASFCLPTGRLVDFFENQGPDSTWDGVLKLASRDWRVHGGFDLYSYGYLRPGEGIERSCLALSQEGRLSDLCRRQMGEESFQGSFSRDGRLIVFVGRSIAMSTEN